MLLKQFARMMLVVLASPFIFMMIAMITCMRPLSAYKDGFRGPERMWSDVMDWARCLPVGMGYWTRRNREAVR